MKTPLEPFLRQDFLPNLGGSWWRPSTYVKLVARATEVPEGKLRELIYENLGAFRMDMIDAMAVEQKPNRSIDDPSYLRWQWRRTRYLRLIGEIAADRCENLEDGALRVGALIVRVIRDPNTVQWALERASAGGIGLVSIVEGVDQGVVQEHGTPASPRTDQQSFGILSDLREVVMDSEGESIPVGGIFGSHR
jgi:hypothetical protein